MTRYDPTAGIGQEDIERVGRHKSAPSAVRLPRRPGGTQHGPSAELGNQTRLAGAFRVLARELAGLVAPSSRPTGDGRSLFGRLTGREHDAADDGA